MAEAAPQYVPRAGNLDPTGDGQPLPSSRLLASNVRHVFNVRAYGAAGNGTTDDTAACQAAIAACQAAGCGTVYFPPGRYLILGTLYVTANGVCLAGAGDASVLLWGFDGDLVHATPPGADGLSGFAVGNLKITPTAVRSSGWAIYAYQTFRAKVRDLRIGDEYHATIPATAPAVWSGVYLDQQSQCEISDCHVYHKRTGIAVSGGGPGSRWGYDGWIRNCEIWGDLSAGSKGVHVGGGTGGLHVAGTNVALQERLIHVDMALSGGVYNRELFLGPGLFLDSGGACGLNVADHSLYNLAWADVWCASMGRNGVTPGTGSGFPYHTGVNIGVCPELDAVYTGGRIFNSLGSGVQLSGGRHQFNGVRIYDNGYGSSGGHGIGCFNAIAELRLHGGVVRTNGNGTNGTGVYASGPSSVPAALEVGTDVYANGQQDVEPLMAAAAARSVQAVLGGPVTLGSSYTNTGLAVLLKRAGTWVVTVDARCQAGGASSLVGLKLVNTTAGADVLAAERLVNYYAAAIPATRQETPGSTWVVTVTGPSTVTLWGKSDAGDATLQSDSSGRTVMTATPDR